MRNLNTSFESQLSTLRIAGYSTSIAGIPTAVNRLGKTTKPKEPATKKGNAILSTDDIKDIAKTAAFCFGTRYVIEKWNDIPIPDAIKLGASAMLCYKSHKFLQEGFRGPLAMVGMGVGNVIFFLGSYLGWKTLVYAKRKSKEGQAA